MNCKCDINHTPDAACGGRAESNQISYQVFGSKVAAATTPESIASAHYDHNAIKTSQIEVLHGGLV